LNKNVSLFLTKMRYKLIYKHKYYRWKIKYTLISLPIYYIKHKIRRYYSGKEN